MIKVKPSPEYEVLDPTTLKPLDKDGEDKPLCQYWRRRLDEGSVIEVTSSRDN